MHIIAMITHVTLYKLWERLHATPLIEINHARCSCSQVARVCQDVRNHENVPIICRRWWPLQNDNYTSFYRASFKTRIWRSQNRGTSAVDTIYDLQYWVYVCLILMAIYAWDFVEKLSSSCCFQPNGTKHASCPDQMAGGRGLIHANILFVV